MEVFAETPGKTVAGGRLAEVVQHAARVNRGQLVLISDQDQAGFRLQCRQEPGHEGEADHAGFVHHQHIRRQGVGGVVAETNRIGYGAQQAVDGRRDTLILQFRFKGLRDRQVLRGLPQKLLEARHRFARWGSQLDNPLIAARLLQQSRPASRATV